MTRRRASVVIIAGIVIVVIFSSVWVSATLNEHAQWMVDMNDALMFKLHLSEARSLLNSQGFQQNTTLQNWLRDEIYYAQWSLNPLGNSYALRRDMMHADLISRIYLGISTWFMCGPNVDDWSCIFGLNQTLRASAASVLYSMGLKMAAAYSNFLNYTSVNDVYGPSIWYPGPVPPDETLLQQVVTLAASLPNYWSS